VKIAFIIAQKEIMVWNPRVTPRRLELQQVIDCNIRKLQDKCSTGMHNKLIWIVKDGQRVEVGAWAHGHHDRLLKLLNQFLTVMSNAIIIGKLYNIMIVTG